MGRRNTTSFTVRPKQGGRLMTTMSSDNVGVANYTVKTNWRRFEDREILREGNLKFRPNMGVAQGVQALEAVLPVIGAWEALRPNSERAVVAATATDIYRYNFTTNIWDVVGTGYSPNTVEWQGEQLDGCLILNNTIDLPTTLRVEDANTKPIYEMREVGISCVGRISVFNGFLMCSDISMIQDDQLNGIMLSTDPYGRVSPSLCNRVRYKFEWSDFGDSRNWSPVIAGVIQSATKNKVTLSFPCPFTFPVGSKLAVIGAGPGGTTLGGQFGIEDGAPVTAVSGNEITLSVSADASLSYPLTVSVTRFADTSTFSASSTIKDDSSPIITHRPLKQALIIYRTSGIWIGRYTGLVEAPFKFTPIYRGAIVPTYPRAIIDVEGDYHLYASGLDFYAFDGAGNPQIHAITDAASKQFFEGLSPANASVPFASHNPITREVWFHSVNGVLAFDYLTLTASWIDEVYTAAVYHLNPNGTDYWFTVAKGGVMLQYGATEAGVITIQRQGAPVQHVIGHGDVTLNDDLDEKDLISYTPLFGEVSNPVTVTLNGRDNVAGQLELLFTETLDNPSTQPLIETFYRNIYFQDRVVYESIDDSPVSYLGSTFSFQGVNSAGVTRNNNGNA